MKLIDTHCHVFAEEFDADREAVIQRAAEAGVTKLLLPNIDAESIAALYKTNESWPEYCLPMMGLHPTSVKEDFKEQLDRIKQELDTRSFIAIGEIGLDYYWDTTFRQEQLDAFRQQLRWAKEKQLPVAIHTRNSFEDAISIVTEEKDERLSGVFHCFTGTLEDAEKVMQAGFMMGIGGVTTFKNGGLDKVLPDVPMEYLILETDSPYLAPVPYRGKRNEPSYLLQIVTKLAGLKQLPVEEMARITSENAARLFKL